MRSRFLALKKSSSACIPLFSQLNLPEFKSLDHLV